MAQEVAGSNPVSHPNLLPLSLMVEHPALTRTTRGSIPPGAANHEKEVGMSELFLVTGEVNTVIPGRSETVVKTRLVRAETEAEAEVKFRAQFAHDQYLVQVFEVDVSSVIE